jgi:transposase
MATTTSFASWPKHLLQALDGIACALMAAYVLLRERAANHAFCFVRHQAELDAKDWKIHLLETELRLLQQRFGRLEPAMRPHYDDLEKTEIIQLMRLRKWKLVDAANHMLLHENTIRKWLRLLENGTASGEWSGVPWNKLSDAVRWTVHKLKQINPALGTRKIGLEIVRAGIEISRASVQRILREEEPKKDKPTKNNVEAAKANCIKSHAIVSTYR